MTDTGISARAAISTRRAVRGFLPSAVAREAIEDILALAAHAPSGSNIQPWQVYVCSGNARRRISDEVIASFTAGSPGQEDEYRYYPRQWREPYQSRRRKIGKDLYGCINVPRGDQAGMDHHLCRNYDFFGAPVGLFFALDRDMEIGSWLDLGMFMQNVMSAARIHGLHTCPLQSLMQYHRIIAPIIGLPEQQTLVCGMALGYEDKDAPANQLVTERAAVYEFARFIA